MFITFERARVVLWSTLFPSKWEGQGSSHSQTSSQGL